MICLPCRTAADAHAPADQHCDAQPGPGAACDCQHRVDRYQPNPDHDISALHTLWERHLGTLYRAVFDAPPLPPAACRCGGQSFAGRILHTEWCSARRDPAPLREVAAQALAAGRTPLCACGGTTDHAPNCPVHPDRLRTVAAAATALLPAEVRLAGIHFAFATTTED